jgi:hypothetical protein
MRDLQTTYSQFDPFHRSTATTLSAVISVLGVIAFVLVFLRQ